jgi:hypothetical protein
MKLATKCSILLTSLSSGLLLSVAYILCKAVIAAFAFAKFSLIGAIPSAMLTAYLDTASMSATFSCCPCGF